MIYLFVNYQYKAPVTHVAFGRRGNPPATFLKEWNMSKDIDLDEFDEDLEELSPSIRAQLELWNATHHMPIDSQLERRQRKLRVRRQIEDWADIRRMRDELDYIR